MTRNDYEYIKKIHHECNSIAQSAIEKIRNTDSRAYVYPLAQFDEIRNIINCAIEEMEGEVDKINEEN